MTRAEELVSSIIESYGNCGAISKLDLTKQPSKDVVEGILDSIKKLIFPGYFESKSLTDEFIPYYVGDLLENIKYNLSKQMKFAFLSDSATKELSEAEIDKLIEEKLDAFLNSITRIREYLDTDVRATFDGDPAATGFDEIIYSYPGIYAIMVNRVAHELFMLQVPIIPRIMTEQAHSATGIDIHPGATIGKYFCIDHGTGIVIGETTVIGEHVKIYQGVTLGGLSTSAGQALKGVKRHPTIMDNVTIYSGASILGGETVIGAGSTIGGNAFITQSVGENTRVTVKNQELVFTERKKK